MVDDQGRSGHGYFRAMPPATAPLVALKATFDHLAQVVVGADERGIHAIMDRMHGIQEGMAPLKASIECALYDLLARSAGLPLHDLYGGRRHQQFANARIVPLKTPEAMAAVAASSSRRPTTARWRSSGSSCRASRRWTWRACRRCARRRVLRCG